MKKIITIIVAVAIIAVLPAGVYADDAFTTEDAIIILKHSAGLVDLTPEQEEKYDLNQDGNVDTDDVIIVLRIIAGLPAFPPPIVGTWKVTYFVEDGEKYTVSEYASFASGGEVFWEGLINEIYGNLSFTFNQNGTGTFNITAFGETDKIPVSYTINDNVVQIQYDNEDGEVFELHLDNMELIERDKDNPENYMIMLKQ